MDNLEFTAEFASDTEEFDAEMASDTAEFDSGMGEPVITNWDEIIGKPTEFPPEDHTHPWSEVEEKPETFPPSSHRHTWGQVDDKPETFPPSSHTHDDRYYTEAEVNTLLSGKSNTGHIHDDRYYTESEVDAQISDVREIAAGKNRNIVVNLSQNPSLNTQDETVSISSLTDIGGVLHPATELKKGDNIFITDTNVPDRWVGTEGSTVTVYKLETAKVPVTDVRVDGTTIVNNGIADITGKQDTIDADNKLSSDLVDDTNGTHKFVSASDKQNWNGKADGNHNHDGRYYTESETDALLDEKASSSHNHDDRYYTESECNGKFFTLNTQQETSAKKVFGYAEPITFGGQETIVKILSTRKSTDMSTRMWAGRMMVGTNDKTFLMGVYKCTSSPICGLGAHSWSSARDQQGAAWENVHIQPDGDKACFIGGFEWRVNSGWLKVQNSNQNSGGKVYYNKGTITSPTWKEVAIIDDTSTTGTDRTWSANKLNSMIGNIEAALNAIRGV